MKFRGKTLALGTIAALIAGGIAPSAHAAPEHCWSWTDEAEQPYHLECTYVASLDDLEIPDTVTELSIAGIDDSVIAGLDGLKKFQQLTSLEIYGATNEAVSALEQLPNLKNLWVTFRPESSVTDASRTALTKMAQLTSLSAQNAGFRNYSWVSKLPKLTNFQANESYQVANGTVGKTLKFAPITDVKGKEIIPETPSWPANPRPDFTKITASSALPMTAGNHRMVASSQATTGTALKSSFIYVDLVADIFDTAKTGPLQVNYRTARKNNVDYQFAVVGDELEVAWGTYGEKNFQWFRNAVAIPGATDRTYKLTSSDAGKKISVKYTSLEKTSWDRKVTYVASSPLSVTYDMLIPASQAKHPVAKLSGTGYATEKLSVAVDPAVFPKAKKTYQWFADDEPIKGATNPSFTPGSSYLKRVHAEVTYLGAHASPVTVPSKALEIERGSLKAGKPTITGASTVGKTLTAKPGTASKKDAKLTYIWVRGGKELLQQNRSTYTLTPADLGKKISVKTQFTHRDYHPVVTQSTATAAIAPGTLATSKKPAVSGKKIAGKTVKVTAGSYSPKAEKVTYQWQRAGKNIKGATKSSYKVVKADKGKKLTVKVSASKKGYSTKITTLTAK